MTTAIKSDIRAFARESVREALRAEFMKMRASALPIVTKREQNAIEKLYKRPSRRAAHTVRVRV